MVFFEDLWQNHKFSVRIRTRLTPTKQKVLSGCFLGLMRLFGGSGRQIQHKMVALTLSYGSCWRTERLLLNTPDFVKIVNLELMQSTALFSLTFSPLASFLSVSMPKVLLDRNRICSLVPVKLAK